MGASADDEALLKQILEQSSKEAKAQESNFSVANDDSMSVAVKTAVSNGFTIEQGIEAESII